MADESRAVQLVIFTLAGEQYAMPINSVQEIIRYRRPRSVASTEPWAQGVLSLRGQIVPVYDLADRLGTTSSMGEDSKIVILLNPEPILSTWEPIPA
jgi:purine-binding chemotaxis protein CheW